MNGWANTSLSLEQFWARCAHYFFSVLIFVLVPNGNRIQQLKMLCQRKFYTKQHKESTNDWNENDSSDFNEILLRLKAFFCDTLHYKLHNYVRIAQNFSKYEQRKEHKVLRYFFFLSFSQGNMKMKANLIKFKMRNRNAIFAFVTSAFWLKNQRKTNR